MELSLTLKSNGTGHKDVVLRFCGREWICDSYYLALDREMLAEIEDEPKVRAVLRRLLEQWLEVIQSLKAGEIAYLPYDFSDQYTGWLRCTCASGGKYVVVRGWAPVEGWSFYPSSVGVLLRQLDGFVGDGPEAEVSASQLVAEIIRSIADAA